MPFKWRLKKTRSYEISSKNSFIVGVYLLDNSFLECTLNSESTGQECLDSIAQRIELTETYYFGLRFVTKKLQFHWIDLERPLKRQLDKYAQPSCHPHCLYFGVMFYVACAHKISDEVARYHYYLQLKNDIIDGRLPCSVEQAVRLAAFSLQVEFGDHEQDKYTVEYFKDYHLLPKNMTKDDATYTDLLGEVMAAHASLQGLPSARAEIQYIKDVLLMDGYGCDYYVAKDESRKDLYLGTSYAGVFVRYLDGQPTVYYRWPEIARLTQNKKAFEIDTSKSSVQFQMEDTETAKYVCRLGQLQHKFYKSSRSNLSGSMEDVSLIDTDSTLFQDNQQAQITQAETTQELTQSQTSLVYQQDQRIPQDAPQTVTTHDYYRHSQQSLDSALSEVQQHFQQQQLQHSQSDIIINGSVYTVSTPSQATSTTSVPQADPVYVNRAALLPAYRPSPDYETVMRQRMAHQVQIQETTQNLGSSHVYSYSEGMSYSQPEIHQSGLQPVYAEEGNYVNAAAIRSYNHNIYANVFHDGHSYYAHRGGPGAVGDRGMNLAVHATYSSPELNVQPHQAEQFPSGSNSETLISAEYHYRPPPPYPRTSSSTPDLAIQASTPSVVINQPDLVASQPLLSGDGQTLESKVSTGQLQYSSSVEQVPVTSLSVQSTSTESHRDNAAESVISHLSHLQVTRPALDQEDTSSEHSCTTFHARESDESSDEVSHDANWQSKAKIHIRMLDPKEAPPQSKTKEVATLRESFRRMMIARSGSVRSSRRSMRESSEAKSLTDSVNLMTVSEQLSESYTFPASKSVPGMSIPPDVLKHSSILVPPENSPDMQEMLEKLGDPPPYPGTRPADELALSELVSSRNVQNDLSRVVPAPSIMQMVAIVPEKSGVDSGQDGERHQQTNKEPSTTKSVSSTTTAEHGNKEEEQENDNGADSGSDSDLESSGTVRALNMGPLKMAAMNGLTLSRSMVMALMNDDTRAPKDERRKILESKISEGQIFIEFEEIPKKASSLECSVAKAPHNQPRNRFKDVLPYDATRVKLNPRKDNPDGYINASHIKLSAANNAWWFIATQAPLKETVLDFWQMVWEQEVDVIAMLTAFEELGKQKCFVYWPQETGSQHVQKYGDFEVELQFMHDSLCYLTSGIMVRHMPSRKEKMVWHLQYTDWPDHGCPEDTYGFLGFLDEVDSVSRLAESEEGSGKKTPVVIHCSAGVGRTGVVVLTMVMKWCLEHNHSVDLPKALSGIRNQRMHMVQTLGQYQFIHDTLIQYLKNTRLI